MQNLKWPLRPSCTPAQVGFSHKIPIGFFTELIASMIYVWRPRKLGNVELTWDKGDTNMVDSCRKNRTVIEKPFKHVAGVGLFYPISLRM